LTISKIKQVNNIHEIGTDKKIENISRVTSELQIVHCTPTGCPIVHCTPTGCSIFHCTPTGCSIVHVFLLFFYETAASRFIVQKELGL
jgi:hypothetical protein